MKTILATVALLSTAVPLLGTSYYPARPKDAKAVYLSADNFPVKGDGIADDSAVLQQAINKVRETTNQGILFVPAGRYRLTKTIYIWPGIRLIGFGATRPVFVLGANTPGFDGAAPSYMLFFAGGRSGVGRTPAKTKDGADAAPPDANPGTFYSAASNIDIEINDGNPTAVGVRARSEEHTSELQS